MNALRRLLGTLVTIAVAAPLVWTAASAWADLRDRPTGRFPVPLAVTGPSLRAGDAFAIQLPRARERYRLLVVRTRGDAPPRQVAARLCVRARCATTNSTSLWGVLSFAIPEGVREGALEVRVLDVRGEALELVDVLGRPALEVVRGFSWRAPFDRAREITVAVSGVDLLPVALLGYAAALLGAVAVCLALAISPRRRGSGVERAPLEATPEGAPASDPGARRCARE